MWRKAEVGPRDVVRGGREVSGAALWRSIILATCLVASPLTAVAEDGLAPPVDAVERNFPDPLFGIALGAGGTAIATGYHGVVRMSEDGGMHWSRIDAGDGALLRRVALFDDGTVFAVSSAGKILKGTAGKAGWQTVYDAQGTYLRDIAFASRATGWAVGHDGLILKTSDGGATWTTQGLKDWPGRDQPRLSGIAAIDDQRAVVVGEFGVVAATRDGGATWAIVSANALPTLLSVAMRGQSGYAVGLNGAVVRLTLPDEGIPAAELVATEETSHLLAVALSPDGTHALIGGRGLFAEFSDGKLTPLDVPPEAGLAYAYVAGIAIGADGTTVAVGQNGLTLRADAPQGPYKLVSKQSVGSDTELPNNSVTQ